MAQRGLISVRTELVLETIVGSMHAAAAERADGDGDGEAWLRSVGRHCRALELERFAPAREPMPWLTALLAERIAAGASPAAAIGAVSADLAAAEPAGRPEPGDAPSWRVPGPGGHVRHYLALRAGRDCGMEDAAAARRAWMAGFFEHCCEEALPPAAPAA